jgi:hypothetical protein
MLCVDLGMGVVQKKIEITPHQVTTAEEEA